MDAPGRPHVRVHRGFIYIERVPNYWVQVGVVEDWWTMNDQEKSYMLSKALKKGWDTILTDEGPSETLPRSS